MGATQEGGSASWVAYKDTQSPKVHSWTESLSLTQASLRILESSQALSLSFLFLPVGSWSHCASHVGAGGLAVPPSWPSPLPGPSPLWQGVGSADPVARALQRKLAGRGRPETPFSVGVHPPPGPRGGGAQTLSAMPEVLCWVLSALVFGVCPPSLGTGGPGTEPSLQHPLTSVMGSLPPPTLAHLRPQ